MVFPLNLMRTYDLGYVCCELWAWPENELKSDFKASLWRLMIKIREYNSSSLFFLSDCIVTSWSRTDRSQTFGAPVHHPTPTEPHFLSAGVLTSSLILLWQSWKCPPPAHATHSWNINRGIIELSRFWSAAKLDNYRSKLSNIVPTSQSHLVSCFRFCATNNVFNNGWLAWPSL